MAEADKERWNKKYQDNPILNTPIELVVKYAKITTETQALDIACGMGRHSKYLASLGFRVDALDVSSVAIASLQGLENIHAKEVDFDTFTLAKEKYDFIVCTYFLERKLFPQMIAALKPNGIIIIETFRHHHKNEKVPSNPDFLLHDGELESYFEKECDLIYLSSWFDNDYTGVKAMKVSMVAKKTEVKKD